MAKSKFITRSYSSERYVESAGCVLFHLPPSSNHTNTERSKAGQICLINYISRNEWLLPKGRLNVDEKRCDAAVREVKEETGYECKLMDLYKFTRRTMNNYRDGELTGELDEQDIARMKYTNEEAFWLQIRELDKVCDNEEEKNGNDENGGGIKLIWWFIGVVDDDGDKTVGQGEEQFKSQWFDYEEAINRLTFDNDRMVVRKAVDIVSDTISRLNTKEC